MTQSAALRRGATTIPAANLFRHARAFLAGLAVRRSVETELSRLTDRQLDDIGMTRYDIAGTARAAGQAEKARILA